MYDNFGGRNKIIAETDSKFIAGTTNVIHAGFNNVIEMHPHAFSYFRINKGRKTKKGNEDIYKKTKRF